ncbi:MAG: Gfo/Idh/MocA family oxidoreductase [Planctomycetaceae bacterium]|jgi:predicted dehydrogenase|nr:Gfo/Idh/MocA family oxidoreductase [Planctomycetaceae bacterium]
MFSHQTKSSRRSFLKVATAAIAVPLVIPSRVVTPCALAQGQTLPNNLLRMGLIGTGRQCVAHNIPSYVRNKRNQVVAICDVDSWRLAEAKKKILELYKKSVSLVKPASIETYVDYKELLARNDIDAVMISTPDHWHATQAIDAMRAGKHVALEKPVIRTITEGKELVKVSAETKRIFRVDSEFRSGKAAHQAAELVRNGRLGKIKSVLVCVPQSDVPCPAQTDMPIPPELDYERWQGSAIRAPYTLNRVHTPQNFQNRPGWMRHLYYCDGMVTNWGTHLLNGALWSLGLDRTFPVEIEGTGTYPDADSFWNVLLKFEIKYRYADGLEITYKTDKPFYRIEGEKGTLEVSFDSAELPSGGNTKGIWANPASLLDEKIDDSDIRFPFRSEKEDFIDSVLTGKETLEPAVVGHCVTSTCLLGHIAIRTGEKLRWNPDKEVFLDNPKAAEYLNKPITTSR